VNSFIHGDRLDAVLVNFMNTTLTCPGCDAVLRLGTTPEPGARFKCPKCGNIVAAPTQATVVAPVRVAPPVARPAASPPIRRRRQGGLSRGAFWSMILGGMLSVAAITGVLVWLLLFRGKDKDAKASTSVETKQDEEKPDAPRRNPDPPRPVPTSLSNEDRERARAATVYIRVTQNDGKTASGSGFFEAESGMVVTNAHVVDMIRPGKPPPRQIDIVIYSGQALEQSVKGTVLGVDRESDLALIKPELEPARRSGIPSLKVASARSLIETQKLYVVGFPFGERLNTSVTFSDTTVSSLHRDFRGLVSRVQVNGGMEPGNSGGPVIDVHGNVVGVAVAGISGTQIKFAIPGDQVPALFTGRLTRVQLDQDFKPRDGKFVVAVRVGAVDPLRRINHVVLDYWTGNPQATQLMPSATAPALGPDCSPRKTAALTYHPERGDFDAELVLDALPESGKKLWVQPVITKDAGGPQWLNGMSFNVDPPVDPKPLSFALRTKAENEEPVHLTTTARLQLDGSSRANMRLLTVETRLHEKTTPTGPAGSVMTLAIDKLEIHGENGQAVILNDLLKQATTDIAKAIFVFSIEPRGSVGSRNVNVSPVPAETRDMVKELAEVILQSYDLAAMPLPSGEARPGQTWQSKRPISIPLTNARLPGTIDVTYTFLGTRQHKGREVGVVEMRASLVRDNGEIEVHVHGRTLFDPKLNLPVLATATAKVEGPARGDGATYIARGELEVRLVRGPEADK
jgi:S1-C subfamily serine protease